MKTKAARLLILLMGLALVAMLFTSVVKRLMDPQLVVEQPARPVMPMTADTPRQQDDGEIGRLMQEAAKKPGDMASLVRLIEALMRSQNWDVAEHFAKRAIVLNVNDAQPLFLLGIIQHNQGKPQEAASTLEKVLAMRDDAALRYSLGVLYLHYLDSPEKGVAHLRAGLAGTGIDPELKRDIEAELQKAQKKAPSPDPVTPASPSGKGTERKGKR